MMEQRDRPDDPTIMDVLKRILSSPIFSRSERLRAFLKYVVENELQGRGCQLKGYTIGVDVFGRPPSFNADSDPLVRVHAGKLRKLLAAYYAAEGASEPIRIAIPKGSYIPEYHHQPTQAAPAGLQADGPTPSITNRWSWLPTPLSSPLAVLSVLPLLLFAPLLRPVDGSAFTVPGLLHHAAIEKAFARDLPRIVIRTSSPGLPVTFAKALHDATAHYRTIATTEPTTRWLRSSAPQDGDPLTFTIRVSRQSVPAGLDVVLSNDALGETIENRFITEAELGAEADILYESLSFARHVLASDGAIFKFAQSRGISSPLMDCMVATDRYRHSPTRAAFHEARVCQEALSSDHRRQLNFAISASALPLHLAR